MINLLVTKIMGYDVGTERGNRSYPGIFPEFDEKCKKLSIAFQKRTGTILESNIEGLIFDDY